MPKSNKSDVATLHNLKKWLQKGELSEIAAEVGISNWQASQVMAGRSKNILFLTKIMERALHNKSLYEKARAI